MSLSRGERADSKPASKYIRLLLPGAGYVSQAAASGVYAFFLQWSTKENRPLIVHQRPGDRFFCVV